MITPQQLYEMAGQVWSKSIRNYHPDIVKEDAIQEAVLRAWQNRSKFDPNKAKAITFFSTVMRNEIHQHAKVRRNNYTALGVGGDPFGSRSLFAVGVQSLLDDATDDRHKNFAREPEPLQQLIEQEDREELQRAIDELPRDAQLLIELRMDDTPLRDIAAMFGVSHQAISARYSRALDQIRDTLGTQ